MQASAEKLEPTGPAEKSSFIATERAVGKYTRAAFAEMKKEQSRLSKAPDRKGGESQGEQEPHLGK